MKISLLVVPAMMILLACGSDADPPPNDQATSSSTGAGGSGGGAATAASTSASSSASSGGSGGAGGGGGAGGSDGEDLLAAAASIDGFRWEMPCEQDPGDRDECTTSTRVDEERTFGGSPDTIYQVTVRLRGVVEPETYKDGTPDGMHFRVGGSPDNPTYNVYSFSVSDPPEVYYLNDSPTVGHDVFIIDHMKTIPIRGGATVSFLGDDPNHVMIANFEHLVVDGVPPAPEPFIGQFIQLDVQSVDKQP
ncbi:hypothetical protein SOCE26_001160 [Sorangium cellulosum]|uniref:Secreted protein n=1 Tax=Sorangium cellulosum TaxID=56 RepID=A0A2L0EHG7_SORCE|nr:hypothetical protein [Sorangium cellulosum]AUX38738.1 hypothetical protein SOCE26_001160 [Sorangium cellulosum]